ncbi:MAG: NUDIX hydrolase [Pseudomonadota bacterium]
MTEKEKSMVDPSFEPDFRQIIPEGDDRERSVCGHCGFVDYQNPKIVVGSVVTFEEQVVLCRRAIEPRKGYWTLPAGYLELGESVEEGAIREAWEEARAQIKIDRVLAIYSVPRISQVQVMFRARLLDEAISAGPESEEVMLCSFEDVPWPEIAFPSAGWALRQWHETRHAETFAPFANPVDGL